MINFTEDGVSGVLSNIENQAIGNDITDSIAIIIPPPTNNFDFRDKFFPRSLSNKLQRLLIH